MRLALRNGLCGAPKHVVDTPNVGHAPLDLRLRPPCEVDGPREVPLLEHLAGLLKEVHRGGEVRASALCGQELVATLDNRLENSLELCFLEGLESLAGEGGALLVSALLDRSFRLLQHPASLCCVRPDPLRLLDPGGEIRDPALKPFLDGSLPLGAALP